MIFHTTAHTLFKVLTICACLPIVSTQSSASISRFADFPLGEPGTLGVNQRPMDVSGNNRHFTSDTNGIATTVITSNLSAPNSSAALDTSASSNDWWPTGPSMTGVTDNFAFGIYARAASNSNGSQGDIIATAPGNSAFKLSLDSTGWNASSHNVAYIGNRTSNFTANTWVHLALIRNNGQTTFYVNGVAQGASYAGTPSVGTISLGGAGTSIFDGQLDEAHFVTFTAGDTNDTILAALQSAPPTPDTTPTLLAQPTDQTITLGTTAMLAAPAIGAQPMTWRWYHGSEMVSESTTSATLTLSNFAESNTGAYHAEITNTHGTISTNTVTLSSKAAPITLAPSTTPNAAQQEMINRKYGMFCHFGINSFQNQQWTDGTISPSTYAPTAVDVEQWVRTAYLSGMTYILIIAKHHDGFCMWPTAETTYSVASSPNHTDVMRLAADACAKYGIKLAVYYSLWDRNWNNGTMRATSVDLTPEQSAAYVSYMKRQFTELLTQYGPVCELWLDGGWIAPDEDWNIPDLYDHVKKIQPNCQFASNLTIGNPTIAPANQAQNDTIRYFPSDFRLHDPNLPKFSDPKVFSHNTQQYYLPFEATITLSSQNFWFYDTRETASKSLQTLENWWNVATAQNNLLVLNAAPDRNGVLLPWDVQTLTQLANRLGLEPGHGFPTNLASSATITASSTLNNDTINYGPTLACDENPDTRWSCATGTTTGWLEMDFLNPTTVSRVIANEYLTRIQAFTIESWNGSSWDTIHTGTTLGESARIDFPAVTTTKIRLNITSASDAPSLWMFKVHSPKTITEVSANDGTWNTAGSGVWQISSLWNQSTTAAGANRTAYFNTQNLSQNATVLLQDALTIGNLSFRDTSPSNDWSLDAVNQANLTLSTSTGTPTIEVSDCKTSISTPISSTQGWIKSGNGTLLLSGAQPFTGPATVNAGTLIIQGSTTPTAAITANAQTTVSGTGTIGGALTIADHATLTPGFNQSGTLTVNGALQFSPQSLTCLHLQKSSTTATNTKITATSNMAVNGTLRITASGSPLAAGDTFTVLNTSAGTVTGNFSTIELPSLPQGLKWVTSSLLTTGTISIAETGAATPTFSQSPGFYYQGFDLSLVCSTPNSTIHYTIDGSMPTPSSPTYSTPITIPANTTTTIHAIATAPAMDASPIASATYTTGTSSLTIQGWYHLGEASTLGTSNRPQDSSGNARHFTGNQNTTTVATTAIGGPLGRSAYTSSASLLCGNNQINGFWNNGYQLPADNAGFEIWVKPTSSYTDGWIMASGSTASHMVLAINGGKFRASVTGGGSWFDDAATSVTTNTWTHLALVRNAGTTTFYVNGAVHGTSTAPVTLGNTTHLAVTTGGGSGFKGQIDEARMFTFTQGAFNIQDLLYRSNQAPIFSPAFLSHTSAASTPLTIAPSVTDPDPADSVIFQKISGPTWLTLNANGSLTGTPTASDVGTHHVQVLATDAFGASATFRAVLTITPTFSDANNNGIADDWEQLMFGNADPNANRPTDDADHDGLCNLLEYALNTHPTQSNPSPITVDFVTINGKQHLRISIPKNPNAHGLQWSIEMADSLDSNAWSSVPVVIDPPESTNLLQGYCSEPTATSPKKFVRVRVATTP